MNGNEKNEALQGLLYLKGLAIDLFMNYMTIVEIRIQATMF